MFIVTVVELADKEEGDLVNSIVGAIDIFLSCAFLFFVLEEEKEAVLPEDDSDDFLASVLPDESGIDRLF